MKKITPTLLNEGLTAAEGSFIGVSDNKTCIGSNINGYCGYDDITTPVAPYHTSTNICTPQKIHTFGPATPEEIERDMAWIESIKQSIKGQTVAIDTNYQPKAVFGVRMRIPKLEVFIRFAHRARRRKKNYHVKC